jgi:hypothetical protein
MRGPCTSALTSAVVHGPPSAGLVGAGVTAGAAAAGDSAGVDRDDATSDDEAGEVAARRKSDGRMQPMAAAPSRNITTRGLDMHLERSRTLPAFPPSTLPLGRRPAARVALYACS